MTKLTREQRSFLFKSGMALVGVIFFISIVLALKALILPVIIGALLAYLLKPLLSAFKYSWLPEGFRVAMLMGFFTSVLFGFTYMVRESIPTDNEQIELMVRMQFKFNQKVDSMLAFDKTKEERSLIQNFLIAEMTPIIIDINNHFSLNEKQSKQFEEHFEKGYVSEKYFEYYKMNKEHKNIARAVSSVGSEENSNDGFKISNVLNVFSIWIVMPLVFLFLLFDKGEIFRYSIKFIPNRYFELTLAVFEEVDTAIGKYLRGTLLECACVGLTMMIGFYAIGLSFKASFIIGLIAGLTNAIPFLGTAVALVVGLCYGIIAEDVTPLIPLMSPDDVLIGIVAVVFGVHLLDNAYFQPVIVGSAVNLHPLVVLLGIFGGSLVFGFAGILLAIPTIVVVKTSAETLYRGLKDYYII